MKRRRKQGGKSFGDHLKMFEQSFTKPFRSRVLSQDTRGTRNRMRLQQKLTMDITPAIRLPSRMNSPQPTVVEIMATHQRKRYGNAKGNSMDIPPLSPIKSPSIAMPKSWKLTSKSTTKRMIIAFDDRNKLTLDKIQNIKNELTSIK